jgi:hypothetical protein
MYSFNLDDIKKDENFPKNLNVLEYDYLNNTNLNKPNSIKLLETDYNFSDPANDNINDYVYNAIFITTATGTDLDNLGRNLGIPRISGESDNDYRFRLLGLTGLFDGYAYVQKILDYFTYFGETVNFWYKYFFVKRKSMYDNAMCFDIDAGSNLEDNLANGIPLTVASYLNYTIRFDLDPKVTTLAGGSTYSPVLDSVISGLVLNDYTGLDFLTQAEIDAHILAISKLAKICSKFIVTPTQVHIPDHNWNLQETSGTDVFDTGFVGRNGTNTNATVNNAGVSTNHKSYYFGGTAYLKHDTIPSYHNFFYSIWINTTNTSGNIINIVDTSGNLDWELKLNTNVLRLVVDRFEGSPLTYDGTTTVNDGNWHHIVIKSDNDKFYLYIDTVEEFTQDKTLTNLSKWAYTSKAVEIYHGVSYEGASLNNYINNTYMENIQFITNPLSLAYVDYYYNNGDGRLL